MVVKFYHTDLLDQAYPLRNTVPRSARDFVQIAALHKKVARFLRFRLSDTAYIPHLGVEVQILIKMALINEKPVNAELFKVDNRILTLGVVEFFELRLDCLSGFH